MNLLTHLEAAGSKGLLLEAKCANGLDPDGGPSALGALAEFVVVVVAFVETVAACG